MRQVTYFSISLLIAVCVIASLLSPPAIGQTVPTPEHQTASQFLQHLSPLPSGPGLVVGNPVPVHCDASAVAFGEACRLWLQIYVGGQGALGQTPPASEVRSADTEMVHLLHLRIQAKDVRAIAQATGATDVAASVITDHGGAYTLSYHIFAADGKPVGKPLVATGSLQTILSDLPAIGRKITGLLGVANASGIPGRISVTASDMVMLGNIARANSTFLSLDQKARLLTIEPDSAIAGLLLLDYQVNDSSVVSTFFDQAQGNPMLLGMAQGFTYKPQPVLESAIDAALVKYPDNGCLLDARATRYSHLADWENYRKNQEMRVRVQPRNPWAWSALGQGISNQADAVRRSRGTDEMSQQELDYVLSLYPLWQAADEQVVRLCPDYVEGYVQLAGSSMFTGDGTLADQSLWKALKLDPTNYDANSWGLQMYQPKWGGDERQMVKLVQMIEKDHDLFRQLAASVWTALGEEAEWSQNGADFDSLAKQTFLHEASEPAVRIDPKGDLTRAITALSSNSSSKAWSRTANDAIVSATLLRRGRVWTGMTSAEQRIVSCDYNWADYAQGRAANMASSNADDWAQLASIEYKAQSSRDATMPLFIALSIDPRNETAYSAGFQMLQPKWGGDHDSLIKLVKMAKNDQALFENFSPDILSALEATTQDDETKSLRDAAQAAFTQLVASNPQDASVQQRLGNYYDQHNQPANALTAFLAWAKLAPNDENAQFRAGRYLEYLGQNDKAVPYYRKTLALDPDHPDALYHLADVLLSENQNGEAESLLRRLVADHPERPSAYVQLGVALRSEGRIAEARSDWQKAIDLDPTNLDGNAQAKQWLEATPLTQASPAANRL